MSQSQKGARPDHIPVKEGRERIFLRRSIGGLPGDTGRYGPGWADVPPELARAVELSPDLAETDETGAPLSGSVAASATPASATGRLPDAIPSPARDEDGALVDAPDDDEPSERTGGTLIGESGSHKSAKNVLHAQPGQTARGATQGAMLSHEDAMRLVTGNNDEQSAPAKEPATKSALTKIGVDELRTIAKDNNVSIDDDATKTEIVEKLYDARVSLD